MELGKHDLVRLGIELRQQILTMYREDSCIATSRATLDALRKLGIDAFEQPVIVAVVNEPMWRWADEHGRFPETEEERPAGAHGVGIGMLNQERPGYWNGHLVVIAGRKWLLDYSIGQASRPEHNMELDVVAVPVNEAWLRGREPWTIYQTPNNVRLYYTKTNNRGYRESPNWDGDSSPVVAIREGKFRTDRRRLIR